MRVITDQYCTLVPIWIMPAIVAKAKTVHDDGLFKDAIYRNTIWDAYIE
jgi:hypothetical protein